MVIRFFAVIVAILTILAPRLEAAQPIGPTVLLVTDWGRVRCPAITCSDNGRTGLELYWQAPALMVVREHRPVLVRTCVPMAGRRHVWDCRKGVRSASLFADLTPDALWAWMPVSGDDDSGD